MFSLFNPKRKEEEALERKLWLDKHTFSYGEKVKVMQGDKVFVIGTIKGFKYSYDDYAIDHYYTVDYGDGKLHTIGSCELAKVG